MACEDLRRGDGREARRRPRARRDPRFHAAHLGARSWAPVSFEEDAGDPGADRPAAGGPASARARTRNVRGRPRGNPAAPPQYRHRNPPEARAPRARPTHGGSGGPSAQPPRAHGARPPARPADAGHRRGRRRPDSRPSSEKPGSSRGGASRNRRRGAPSCRGPVGIHGAPRPLGVTSSTTPPRRSVAHLSAGGVIIVVAITITTIAE